MVKWHPTGYRRWISSPTGSVLLLVLLALVGDYSSRGVFAASPLPDQSDVLYHAASVSSIAATRDVDSTYFLPNTTVPTHYSISLRTDIHNDVRTFSAITRIYLTVLAPTDLIVMHVQELKPSPDPDRIRDGHNKPSAGRRR